MLVAVLVDLRRLIQAKSPIPTPLDTRRQAITVALENVETGSRSAASMVLQHDSGHPCLE